MVESKAKHEDQSTRGKTKRDSCAYVPSPRSLGKRRRTRDLKTQVCGVASFPLPILCGSSLPQGNTHKRSVSGYKYTQDTTPQNTPHQRERWPCTQITTYPPGAYTDEHTAVNAGHWATNYPRGRTQHPNLSVGIPCCSISRATAHRYRIKK